MNRRILVALILIVIPTLIACGDAINPTSVATAVPYIDPAFGTELTEGQNLYAQHCAACHGQNGEGLGPFPALNAAEHAFVHPDWEYLQIMTDGRNAMPPFKDKLSHEQMTLIIARMKAWWDIGRQSEQRQLCTLYPGPTPTPD